MDPGQYLRTSVCGTNAPKLNTVAGGDVRLELDGP